MKKNILFTAIALSSLNFLLSGCFMPILRYKHENAQASIDFATGHHKGPSPEDLKMTPGENVGWQIVEPFITMTGNPSRGSQFDQSDPLPGGPSDGQGTGNHSFMRSPAASPDKYFSLSEELEFVGKGMKFGGEAGGGETDHIYYLELPVLLNYNMKINGGNELHFGAGPYAAVALFGRYSSTFNGQTTSGSLKFGSNADFPRMDYGLQLGAGYMITSKFSVNVSYDWGLRNLNSGPPDELYNSVFGVSVGYWIK
jgi:hypothetical protein